MKATKTELKQAVGKLLRAAFTEPVVITDHGKDSHVLMTIEHYERLTKEKDKQITPNSDATNT